jgi:hypothetical protein
LTLIKEYVLEGGRLFLTSNPPYDPPNPIIEPFGVGLGEKVIKDKQNHEGKHDDHILVRDLTDHPINEGVKTIRFGDYGCHPINIINADATSLGFSSSESDPPKAPVAALIPHGKGFIMAIGQTSLFKDKYMGDYDNSRWFRNILGFLLTTRQIETDVKPEIKTEEPPTYNINHCTKCGAKIEAGDLFCGNCGQSIR